MDEMKIEILADGTIKTETSPISPQNHASAETFLKDVAVMTGGKFTRQRRGHHAGHGHHHTHVEHKA